MNTTRRSCQAIVHLLRLSLLVTSACGDATVGSATATTDGSATATEGGPTFPDEASASDTSSTIDPPITESPTTASSTGGDASTEDGDAETTLDTVGERPPALGCVAGDVEFVPGTGDLMGPTLHGVARASGGATTIVWTDATDQTHSAVFDGGAWGAPFVLSDRLGRFAAAPDGRATFMSFDDGILRIRNFDDAGWSAEAPVPIRIDPGAGGLALGVGAGGHTALAWYASGAGLLAAIADDGQWSAPVQIVPPWVNGFISTAVGGDGSVVVQYSESEETAWTVHYDPQTATWGDPVLLADDWIVTRLAIDADGRPFAMWRDENAAHVARYDAAVEQWSPSLSLVGDADRLDLAVGGGDTAILATTADGIPSVSTYDPDRDAWTTEQLENTATFGLIGAVVVADSSGNAIMAWRAAEDVAIRCFDASTRVWSARVEIDTDGPSQLDVAITEDGGALVGILAPSGLWAFLVE